MLTEADRKLLVEAQGGCWHEPDRPNAVGTERFGGGLVVQKCTKCKSVLSNTYETYETNPTFTDPPELGPLILWAVKQGWWTSHFMGDDWAEGFDLWAAQKCELPQKLFMRWLFQSTEHFAKLLIEFGKEHLGWGKEKNNE